MAKPMTKTQLVAALANEMGTDKIYIQGQIIDTEARAFFPTFWRRDEQ